MALNFTLDTMVLHNLHCKLGAPPRPWAVKFGRCALKVKAFAAKPGAPQGPKKGRSLDLGGAAKEEAIQDENDALSRPQARPQQQSQAQRMGQRPQGQRPQGPRGPQDRGPAGRPQNGQQQNRPQSGQQPSRPRPQFQSSSQGQRRSGPPGGQRQGPSGPRPSRKREAAQDNVAKDPDAPPMNQEITFPELRVLDSKKESLGVMPTQRALEMAMEQDVDLILLNADVSPPLARLAQLSKLKFEQAKKEKDQRKKQRESRSDTKELRFRPNTEEHDYNVRLKNAKKHLSKRFIGDLGEDAAVQRDTSMQGNQMTLIVGPKAK